MLKTITLGILISLPVLIWGQELELMTGPGWGTFAPNELEEPKTSAYAEGGLTYYLGLSFYQKRPSRKMAPLHFQLFYEHYQGELYSYSGGRGSGGGQDVSLKRQVIGINYFLLDWSFFRDHLQLAIGPEVSFILTEDISGVRTYWDITGIYTSESITGDNIKSPWARFGGTAKLKYRFPLAEDQYLSLQTLWNMNLTPEFTAPVYHRARVLRFLIGYTRQL